MKKQIFWVLLKAHSKVIFKNSILKVYEHHFHCHHWFSFSGGAQTIFMLNITTHILRKILSRPVDR